MLKTSHALRTRILSHHFHHQVALSTTAGRAAADKDVRKNRPKAVIFDMGGVLIPAPGPLFAGKRRGGARSVGRARGLEESK